MLLVLIVTCSGCDFRERENAIRQKEAALAQKEQELTVREKTLQLREDMLLKKQQQMDSVAKDTALIFDPGIVGKWNVKMTCTETTCPGSAIGDTKSETWDFSYQANSIVVKAKTGEKLERIYTGTYKNDIIQLNENVDVPTSEPVTKIIVKLTKSSPTAMEGQREIIREGTCKIVYALQLSKP